MVYGNDRLLLAPKIVTVTFPNEAKASTFEAFGDLITTTHWWDEVAAGYCDKSNVCIGHGTNGGHVHVSTAAAKTYTDSTTPGDASTIKDFIKAHVADGSFPAPDDNTLYVIYFPTGSTISMKNGTQNASSCQQFGGYHNNVQIGSVQAAYAIIPQCSALLGINVTTAASHEIIEAATDPLVGDTTANGYYMDQTRDAWLAVGAGEVGDVCALLQAFGAGGLGSTGPGPHEYVESGYTVSKSFSNKSVKENHAPCVPAAAGPYFAVAPEVEKLVLQTGQSKTIELTGFSDGPTSDWDVKVMDMGALSNPFAQPVLGLTLDAAKANNGTKLHLTVKVNGTVDATNGAPYVIIASSGNVVNYWPGIVETK